MNGIDNTFDELKRRGKKALVGFVTAGDPDIHTSFDIVASMCGAGLDVLELGVSFSDPTADGPAIQRSSARAIEKGTNVEAVLSRADDCSIDLSSSSSAVSRISSEAELSISDTL